MWRQTDNLYSQILINLVNFSPPFLSPLYRLKQLKAKNKMNTENLSIVFGPTMLRAPNDQSVIDNLYMLQFQKKLVELLIENPDYLFEK